MSEEHQNTLETRPTAPSLAEKEALAGAGFWIRALARIIDLVIHNVIYLVAAIVVMIVAGIIVAIAGGNFEAVVDRVSDAGLPGILGAMLGYVAYSTLQEGIHGSTLGKLICGLTVIKQNETYCSVGAGFKRSLAFYVDSLFFGIPAAASMSDDRQKRRIGDRWAKTMVVRRRIIEGVLPPRSWTRFILALFLGVILDGAFISAGLFIKAMS